MLFGRNNPGDPDAAAKETSRCVLRILIGGYLVYLGVQILKGLKDPESTVNPTLLTICSIVFIVIGAGFALYALRRMIILSRAAMSQGSASGPDAESETAETTETEELPSSEMTDAGAEEEHNNGESHS